MPNWVNNRLYVKNTGPEFNTLREVFTKNEYPFEKFQPMPRELTCGFVDIEDLIKNSERKKKGREYWCAKINRLIGKPNYLAMNPIILRVLDYSDITETLLGDGVKHRVSLKQRIKIWFKRRREEINTKKFGAKDWYDWRVINWGTKWDACDLNVIYSGEDEFCIEFETAWNFPTKIYERLGLDYPNSSLMMIAWSIESDFLTCATRMAEKDWVVEELGSILDERNQELDPMPKPSKLFFGFSKQFTTPLPSWLLDEQHLNETEKPAAKS
jgi:hypothetical protein